MNNDEIAIFMVPEDAKLFIEFQKHYELFSLLVAKKVFDQKGAAVTLHFDIKGHLRTVARSDLLYSSAAPFDNTNEKMV